MLENRPIVVITIGYIVGIISGLYCKISIAILYFILISIYLILKKPPNRKFKLISFRRYFRYVKIIITKKVIVIVIIISILSNCIILYQTKKYNNFRNKFDNREIVVEATVVSNAKDKKYTDNYTIKISKIIFNNGIAKIGNVKCYLEISNKNSIKLKYGNRINVRGTFSKPKTRTNYRAFDYSEYLQTLGIYGTIKAKNVCEINNMRSKHRN